MLLAKTFNSINTSSFKSGEGIMDVILKRQILELKLFAFVNFLFL